MNYIPATTSLIRIYDLSGNEYYSGIYEFIDQETEIDLSGYQLQPRIYMVKVEAESGTKVLRIIIRLNTIEKDNNKLAIARLHELLGTP